MKDLEKKLEDLVGFWENYGGQGSLVKMSMEDRENYEGQNQIDWALFCILNCLKATGIDKLLKGY